MFQQTNDGFTLKIKVIPKASKSSIKGWESGVLVVRLAAVPEKGEANDELIRYLSKCLCIGKTSIELVQGERSRHKRVCIKGLTEQELCQKLMPDP